MAIDEKTLTNIRQLEAALTTDSRGKSTADLCKIYAEYKPLLDLIIAWVEKLPGYGLTLAKLLRLLEALADSSCGIREKVTKQEEPPTLQRGEGTHPLGLASMAYVYWTFNTDIRRGDCTIRAGATFYLFQDGSTRWVCDISSSDSGDEWDGSMTCTNAGGVHLWSDHYHFDISDENVWKRWDEPRGPSALRAASFTESQGLIFSCSC